MDEVLHRFPFVHEEDDGLYLYDFVNEGLDVFVKPHSEMAIKRWRCLFLAAWCTKRRERPLPPEMYPNSRRQTEGKRSEPNHRHQLLLLSPMAVILGRGAKWRCVHRNYDRVKRFHL